MTLKWHPGHSTSVQLLPCYAGIRRAVCFCVLIATNILTGDGAWNLISLVKKGSAGLCRPGHKAGRRPQAGPCRALIALFRLAVCPSLAAVIQPLALGTGVRHERCSHTIHEDMSLATHTKEAIRAAMDHLIDRATKFDVDALETIYHKDFHTTLVLPDSKVNTFDKQAFIAHFRQQAEDNKKAGAPKALNTWADWHDFHVLGDSAVCVLTRKHSGMTGEEMRLLCNIEWRFDDGRWQVLREQIFLRPLEG